MDENSFRPVNVALIGLGFAGTNLHLPPLLQNPRANLVAVCDEDPDKVTRFRHANPHLSVQSTNDWKNLIGSIDCDAVFVATPTLTHLEISEAALAAGRHVFCEKPVSISLSDAQKLLQSTKEHEKQIVMIGQVLRFWPEYVQAHNVVRSGRIGEARIARASRCTSMPSGWFAKEELSGGVILDLMLHDIDFLYWTLGPVDSVYAQGNDCLGRGEAGFVDYAQVHLSFASGAIAHLEASWAVPNSFPFSTSLEISGSKGILTMDNKEQSTSLVTYTNNEPAIASQPAEFNGYYYEIDSFLHAVQEGLPSPIAVSDVIAPLAVALAAKESIRTGKKVSLDASKDTIGAGR